MANRAVIQAVKRKLPLEVLPRGQRERDKNTDILRIDREPLAHGCSKAVETALGILEPGVILQDTPVQLPAPDEIFRKS